MAIDLPRPIESYFAAERDNNFAAMVQLFSADAIVRDEGQEIKGRAEIARWIAEAKRKYHHTTEPLAVAQTEGDVVVSARLAGAFPGSPVDVRHIFHLAGDRIASLEIRP